MKNLVYKKTYQQNDFVSEQQEAQLSCCLLLLKVHKIPDQNARTCKYDFKFILFNMYFIQKAELSKIIQIKILQKTSYLKKK